MHRHGLQRTTVRDGDAERVSSQQSKQATHTCLRLLLLLLPLLLLLLLPLLLLLLLLVAWLLDESCVAAGGSVAVGSRDSLRIARVRGTQHDRRRPIGRCQQVGRTTHSTAAVVAIVATARFTSSENCSLPFRTRAF